MKLKFMQTGGAVLPPFATYTGIPYQGSAEPSAATATTTTTKTGDGSGKGKSSSSSGYKGITDKDIFDLLKDGKLLPNDAALIINEAEAFSVKDAARRKRLKLLGIEEEDSSPFYKYANILRHYNTAIQNKAQFTEAQKHAEAKGTLNEKAITDRGLLVCTNGKGDFKFMRPEELSGEEEYRAMTNQELLSYRAYNKDLAFNTTILDTVGNSVSMDSVFKSIQDIVTGLGNSQEKNSGYFSNKKELLMGLQAFNDAVSKGEVFLSHDASTTSLYKYELLTKTQKNQAEQAMMYILKALPDNAKALLKLKGGGTDEGALEILQNLIASKISTTHDFNLDLQKDSTKDTKDTTKDTKDNTKLAGTQLVNFVSGVGGSEATMYISDGSEQRWKIDGKRYNTVLDGSGNAVENTSLDNMLNQSRIKGLIKGNAKITFGDQKLSNEDLKNITYNGTGVFRVNLPIKADGTVDFDYNERVELAKADLALLGKNPSKEKVKEILDKRDVHSFFNEDGTIIPQRFGAFLVAEGYTTDALININENSSLRPYRVKEGQEGNKPSIESIAAFISDSLSIKNSNGEVKRAVEVDTGWFSDDIYAGAIFIPIDSNIANAATLDGQKLDRDELEKYEKEYQLSTGTLYYGKREGKHYAIGERDSRELFKTKEKK